MLHPGVAQTCRRCQGLSLCNSTHVHIHWSPWWVHGNGNVWRGQEMRTTCLTTLEKHWQSFPVHTGSRVCNPLHRSRTVGSAQATIQCQEQAKTTDITTSRKWDLSSLLTEVLALLGRGYLHLQGRKCLSETFSHQTHHTHSSDASSWTSSAPQVSRKYHGREEMQRPKTVPCCRVGLVLLLF